MLLMDISERKQYNRIVCIAFIIGVVIFGIIGFIGTRPETWGYHQYQIQQSPHLSDFEINVNSLRKYECIGNQKYF